MPALGQIPSLVFSVLCDLGLFISGSQFSYLRKHKNGDFPHGLTVRIKCVKASRTLATVTAANCVPAAGTGADTRCQAPSPAGHQHRSFLQPPAETSLGLGSFMSEWIFFVQASYLFMTFISNYQRMCPCLLLQKMRKHVP